MHQIKGENIIFLLIIILLFTENFETPRIRGIYYALGYYYLYKKLPKEMKEEDFGHFDKKAFLSYMENKIKKEELIEKIRECYKDLPVWLDINMAII